jgi:hypothetical protein
MTSSYSMAQCDRTSGRTANGRASAVATNETSMSAIPAPRPASKGGGGGAEGKGRQKQAHREHLFPPEQASDDDPNEPGIYRGDSKLSGFEILLRLIVVRCREQLPNRCRADLRR